MNCSPPSSSVHEILRQEHWSVLHFLLEGSWPRDPTHVSLHLLHWQAGSLPLAPHGKPCLSKTSLSLQAQHTDKRKQCLKVKVKVLVAQSCSTLRPHGLSPVRLLCLRDSPGKNTGVGSHFLLQEIFPTQDTDRRKQLSTFWLKREGRRGEGGLSY